MMKTRQSLSGLPLTVSAANGLLTISIGVDRLDGHEYHLEIPALKFEDREVWVEEVIRELLREEEDGATLLTKMLDTAMVNALENGALGIAEDSPTFIGGCEVCREDVAPLRHSKNGATCPKCSK